MQYITSRALAEKWGVSQRRIVRLAVSGRIDGARLCGKSWLFPSDAQKPTDGRTQAGKAERDAFRFPFFVHKDAQAFIPPLTPEEQRVKAVVEAVITCRVAEADALLGDLPDTAQNRYNHIAALYCGCMVSILTCSTSRFLDCYSKLQAALQKDFPHKAEMAEYLHEIDAALGEDSYYSDTFHRQPIYTYHESFLPRLCNLSALRLVLAGKSVTAADLTAYEINCAFLEKTDSYFDMQALHIYLACAYAMTGQEEASLTHFRRALVLAEKYELFFTLAMMQQYYPQDMLYTALAGFSAELRDKIITTNRDLHTKYVLFINAMHLNSIYKLLTKDDYIYVAFAVQGLTHKEVARRLHISLGTVGSRYNEVYTALGVHNKAELIRLYHRLTDSPGNIQGAQ